MTECHHITNLDRPEWVGVGGGGSHEMSGWLIDDLFKWRPDDLIIA